MTAEVKQYRVSTDVPSLLKQEIDYVADGRGITRSELLRRAIKTYLHDGDVHKQLEATTKEYQKLKEVARLAKAQIDDLEVDCKHLKERSKRQCETLGERCREIESLQSAIQDRDNRVIQLEGALEEAQAELEAVNSRGFFARLFNLKPKPPKPIEAKA